MWRDMVVSYPAAEAAAAAEKASSLAYGRLALSRDD